MNNFLSYINQWYYERSFSLNKLYYYQIHITKRCQNRCDHCYYREIGSDVQDIDLSYLIKCINDIAINAHALSLTPRVDFTGGDPFLYPYIGKAIDACRKQGIAYGFKCNPDFFIKNRSADILSLIHDCSEISLSIDGLRSCHDSWRGEGNFSNTIKAAGIVKELGFYLRLNTTLSRKNLNNLLPLVDFILGEGILVDDYTWARYWSLNKIDDIIPAKDLPTIFEEYTSYLLDLFENPKFYRKNDQGDYKPKIFFGFKEHQWFPFFVNQGFISNEVYGRMIETQDCLNCTATKHLYIMDPDETIYKCRKLTCSQGSYLDRKMPGAFSIRDTSNCSKCIYYNGCGGCAAMSLSFTGNYNCIEPGCAFYKVAL